MIKKITEQFKDMRNETAYSKSFILLLIMSGLVSIYLLITIYIMYSYLY